MAQARVNTDVMEIEFINLCDLENELVRERNGELPQGAIDDEIVKTLKDKKYPGLVHLNISSIKIVRQETIGVITDFILANNVVRVNAARINFCKHDVLPLFQAITTKQSLQKLSFKLTLMTPWQLSALMSGLESNKTVTSVNLSGVRAFCNHIIKSKLAARLLAKNNVITELVLAGWRFDADCAKNLAQGLRDNRTLQILDVSDNLMGDGVGFLLGALEPGSALTTLKVNHNGPFSDGSIHALTRLLREQTTLSVLSLTEYRAPAIAEQSLGYEEKEIANAVNLKNLRAKYGDLFAALERNKSFTDVTLHISDEYIANMPAVVSMLEGNKKLRRLQLPLLQLSDANLNLVIESLATNSHLQSLSLPNSFLPENIAVRLCDTLEKANRNLYEFKIQTGHVKFETRRRLDHLLLRNKDASPQKFNSGRRNSFEFFQEQLPKIHSLDDEVRLQHLQYDCESPHEEKHDSLLVPCPTPALDLSPKR